MVMDDLRTHLRYGVGEKEVILHSRCLTPEGDEVVLRQANNLKFVKANVRRSSKFQLKTSKVWMASESSPQAFPTLKAELR